MNNIKFILEEEEKQCSGICPCRYMNETDDEYMYEDDDTYEDFELDFING